MARPASDTFPDWYLRLIEGGRPLWKMQRGREDDWQIQIPFGDMTDGPRYREAAEKWIHFIHSLVGFASKNSRCQISQKLSLRRKSDEEERREDVAIK